MSYQPGEGSGTGAGLGRDPRLSGFAKDGEWDTCPPSGQLAVLLEELAGPEQRCPGATDDELVGMLRRWAAIESSASARKLALIREMMHRDEAPQAAGRHGDLPDECSQSLRYELAAALACSTQAAETIAWVARELAARLPGIGALLADGTLGYAKAKAVAEALMYLTDADAARAEAMILGQLAGKTHRQVENLAVKAALTVDPELAERRRRLAEKHAARIEFFREQSGAAALLGRDLPPDEALAAHGNVCARAERYKQAAVFAKTGMDLLRAYAYLDLINDVTPEDRIAAAAERLAAGDGDPDGERGSSDTGDGDGDGDHGDGGTGDGDGDSDTGDSDGGDSDAGIGDSDDDGGDGDSGTGDGDGGDSGGGGGAGTGDDGDGGPGPAPGGQDPGSSRSPAVPPRPLNLVIPLATLLGLAGRPGESHALGPIDPALARILAAAAARDPRTEWCLTITSPEGYAIGHGCFRPARASRAGMTNSASGPPGPPGPPGAAAPPPAPPVALAARVNLTLPASALPVLPSLPALPDVSAPWTFTATGDPGPPGGFGTWQLTLPGGRHLTAKLELVPTYECDHRRESNAYQPNATLRHLVQVRDGTCGFPPCNRHARESDFEHAVPYHKGGRTCACNAGARSRACHRVKQTPGWKVTQPRPGWHEWITPAGRTYVQEPKRYPA